MTKREKLLASIRNNPKAVRFEDACAVAIMIDFIHEGGSGSHRVFKRKGATQLPKSRRLHTALSG
jgi:hypothetical protein